MEIPNFKVDFKLNLKPSLAYPMWNMQNTCVCERRTCPYYTWQRAFIQRSIISGTHITCRTLCWRLGKWNAETRSLPWIIPSAKTIHSLQKPKKKPKSPLSVKIHWGQLRISVLSIINAELLGLYEIITFRLDLENHWRSISNSLHINFP